MFINIKCNKSDENGRGNFSNVMLVATVKQNTGGRGWQSHASPFPFTQGHVGLLILIFYLNVDHFVNAMEIRHLWQLMIVYFFIGA
jgi:hypothetical protein